MGSNDPGTKPLDRLRALETQLERSGENSELLGAIARVHRGLDDSPKAERFVRRSLALDSSNARSWNTLGAVLMDQRRWKEAEAAFASSAQLDASSPHAEDNLALALQQQAWGVHMAAQQADWGPFERDSARLLSMHRKRMALRGEGLVAPFSVLGFHLSPQEHQAAAEAQARTFLKEQGLPMPPTLALPTDLGARRIRVGYLSADFRDNAAGHLLHRLFAAHDRDRFEVFAFSYGPDDGSDFRRAIVRGVEHFIDGQTLDDEALAKAIRESRIDLMVDLMGFAGNHRAGVLARRPAPRQVLWLGYCMTTGAPWIDAFVADEISLPRSLESAFSERIIRLPGSYQVYSGQPIPDDGTKRSALGLPEDACVFCSFNMPEKVDPPLFARWMDILSNVPESVLWLLCDRESTKANYRARAQALGVDPTRIVAAPLVSKKAHLARLPMADLFLDSTLCNGHTTASDALWAGVPVLTRPGALFAQRVAASVCTAAGLPDLIVPDDETYVRTAVELGNDPARRRALRGKLMAARDQAPLFDVPRFCRNLEAAFDAVLAHDRSETGAERRAVPVVAVLGQWRSGSSALAGVLAKLGFHLGSSFATLQADIRHRDTWEAEDLIPILWKAYREPDLEQQLSDAEICDALVGWIERHRALCSAQGAVGLALKHPSLSLAADALRKAVPELLTIRTERSVDHSWDSMQRAGWSWPEAQSRRGLERQAGRAASACAGPVFAFPAFIEEPERTVDRLIEFLQLSPTAEMRSRAIASLVRPGQTERT